MDIFIRNVPQQANDKQLRGVMKPLLKAYGIQEFHCNKFRKKPMALVTVLDTQKALEFLSKTPICNFLGKTLILEKSTKQPDPMILQSLQKELRDRGRYMKKTAHSAHHQPTVVAPLERKYAYITLSCGVWDTDTSDPQFISHFADRRGGQLMFGKHALALLVDSEDRYQNKYRIDFSYHIVQSITLGDSASLSLTFTLNQAPKIYGVNTLNMALHIMMSRLLMNSKSPAKRSRLSYLSSNHEHLVASCFVYRIQLREASSLQSVEALLKTRSEKLPPTMTLSTSLIEAKVPFYQEMNLLSQRLSNPQLSLSFDVCFQLQRLAQNGYLPPARVFELLPSVCKIFNRAGAAVCVEAIRRLLKQIPYAGPEADTKAFQLHTLVDILNENEQKGITNSSYRLHVKLKHDHIALVHKATVTPTGIYLEGPEPESKNRVLRKYSNHTDCFLRVSFLEEDGERLHFDKHVSLEEIYHKRFKGVLEDAIQIAGRKFEFLGFSHSSLREQTCWFMAPFFHEGKRLNAKDVIARLGDFSDIHCAAKCAARIGQAFSDTNGTVSIAPDTVRSIPEVERNGRIFSDGCGVFSSGFLRKILRDYGIRRSDTSVRMLQIRWAGAKGMISLDTRLAGEQILLRGSMIKFESPEQAAIEICTPAACLPMRLNQQFIKIMEDLGVEPEGFLELQRKEVEKLKVATQNPIKAAKFLEDSRIGEHARLPWLLRKLNQLELDPLNDHFLRGILELASILQLRDLKYRARIPVEDGVTLFGIMDETDTLEEGQLYCCTDKFVVTGKVTITRAPALHPGDVRIATCVEVPDDSPLNALHNCIVFSQRGSRDLPSQLSGGDLDGDLYQLSWDSRLLPKRVLPPADYPRVESEDLGRPVERQDITKFFINFMENDQLGRIANLHKQLADYKPAGTLDSDCLILADLHSTAVDFSKTGVPAKMERIPRYRSFRPDFMAPGPRCKIESQSVKLEEEMSPGPLDEGDIIADLDPESAQIRYYESNRVLGRLYREIDEYEFLQGLKRDARSANLPNVRRRILLDQIWSYVKEQVTLIQWRHHKHEARDIREVYEQLLSDVMDQRTTSSKPLTEIEVFSGFVLGKEGGMHSKRNREAATGLKEEFDRNLDYTIGCILKELDEHAEVDRDEALARSIACLAVAVEEPGMMRQNGEKLCSFGYIAAALCLKEIELFQGKKNSSFKAPRNSQAGGMVRQR